MYCYVLTKGKNGGTMWTVGHYDPDGKFVPEGDYETPGAAAARVHYLNGGN